MWSVNWSPPASDYCFRISAVFSIGFAAFSPLFLRPYMHSLSNECVKKNNHKGLCIIYDYYLLWIRESTQIMSVNCMLAHEFTCLSEFITLIITIWTWKILRFTLQEVIERKHIIYSILNVVPHVSQYRSDETRSGEFYCVMCSSRLIWRNYLVEYPTPSSENRFEMSFLLVRTSRISHIF